MSKEINKIIIVKENDEYNVLDEFDQHSPEIIEAYNKGMIWQIGIFVRAELVINETIQHVQSAGCWGIWSNTEQSEINRIALEELEQLKDILKELGFDMTDIDKKIELGE